MRTKVLSPKATTRASKSGREQRTVTDIAPDLPSEIVPKSNTLASWTQSNRLHHKSTRPITLSIMEHMQEEQRQVSPGFDRHCTLYANHMEPEHLQPPGWHQRHPPPQRVPAPYQRLQKQNLQARVPGRRPQCR